MSSLDIRAPHPADIEGRGLDDSRAGHRSLGPNPHRGRLNSDTPSSAARFCAGDPGLRAPDDQAPLEFGETGEDSKD